MAELSTAEDLIAEILMVRADGRYCVLVVEGNSDKRLFERFVNLETTQVLQTFGRPKALHIFEHISQIDIGGVLWVLDADFGNIDGFEFENEDILYTDEHDIEVLLIESQAFYRLVAEYGSQTKIRDRYADNLDGLRQEIYSITSHIGAIRLLSTRNNWGLDFVNIRYERYLSSQDLTINLDRLIASLVNSSDDSPITINELREALAQLDYSSIDNRQLCNGHDFLALLGIALRRILGSCRPSDVSEENISRALRLAVDSAEFLACGLVNRIRGWEAEANLSILN